MFKEISKTLLYIKQESECEEIGLGLNDEKFIIAMSSVIDDEREFKLTHKITLGDLNTIDTDDLVEQLINDFIDGYADAMRVE